MALIYQAEIYSKQAKATLAVLNRARQFKLVNGSVHTRMTNSDSDEWRPIAGMVLCLESEKAAEHCRVQMRKSPYLLKT